MNNKIKIIFLFFFLNNLAYSQKLEYGKVSKDELLEKSHPKDKDAPAAVLFKKAKTYFYYTENKGFKCETIYEIRLKIYKKEGLEYANYSIPYYIGWNELEKDNVFFSDVVTYNFEDDKIVKTKLNSQGTFQEQINEYWMKKTITFPNVKEGSVIEFKYKLVSENLAKLPDFDFQELIPVNYAEYKTEIPVNYEYKTVLRGFTKVEHESKDETFSQAFNTAYTQTKQLSYTIRKQKFSLKDIPKLEIEPYIDNVENYRIKIESELTKIQFPDTPAKLYSETWEDVARDISNNKEFRNELESKGYFEVNVKKILAENDAKMESINAIFQHVKNQIKWDGTYGYYPKAGVKNAYLKRSGNVADINLNLIVMLRYAGFNAMPLLLSTRNNGKVYFPSREGFNYVIAYLSIDGNMILLDATDKSTALNILPIRCLNGSGRTIMKIGSSEEIVLNPKSLSKSITFIQADLNAKGQLSGKFRNTKSDYKAYVFRNQNEVFNQENYIEKLEDQYQNIQIDEFSIENLKDNDKPILETFSFSSADDSEFNGDKIMLNPFLFLTKSINPFKAEKRDLPIDFVFPTQEKFMININIPDGFKVDYLPQPVTVALPNNDIMFSFNIINEKSKIIINSVFNMNIASYDAAYYEDIKKIFKIYVEKQTESIILKKI